MKLSELQELAESVTESSQLRLIFKPDNPGVAAWYLLAMIGRILEVDTGTRLNLLAIRESDKWGHDSNRTVVVKALSAFDKEWFINRLSGYLQNVEVC